MRLIDRLINWYSIRHYGMRGGEVNYLFKEWTWWQAMIGRGPKLESIGHFGYSFFTGFSVKYQVYTSGINGGGCTDE